jgi:hypothetical protein
MHDSRLILIVNVENLGLSTRFKCTTSKQYRHQMSNLIDLANDHRADVVRLPI